MKPSTDLVAIDSRPDLAQEPFCSITAEFIAQTSTKGVVFCNSAWREELHMVDGAHRFAAIQAAWVTALRNALGNGQCVTAPNVSIAGPENPTPFHMQVVLSRDEITNIKLGEIGSVERPENSSERTIGLSWPTIMRDEIRVYAEGQNRSISGMARQFFRDGLKDFDSSLEREKRASVLQRFRDALKEFGDGATARSMLRVNRADYADASVIANKLELPLSEVALMCIASSLRVLRSVMRQTGALLNPAQLERAVRELLSSMQKVTLLETHGSSKEHFSFDLQALLPMLGAEVPVLINCQQSPVIDAKEVTGLSQRMASLGAQVGLIVAAAPFARSAVDLAEKYGIVAVQLASDESAASRGWLLRAKCKAEVSKDDPTYLDAQLKLACMNLVAAA